MTNLKQIKLKNYTGTINISITKELGAVSEIEETDNVIFPKYKLTKKGRRISKYWGVTATKGKKWLANINFKGKNYYLGTYNTEDEAQKEVEKQFPFVKNGTFKRKESNFKKGFNTEYRKFK